MNGMPYFGSYFFMRKEERFKLLRKRFFPTGFSLPFEFQFCESQETTAETPEDHNRRKIRLTECNAKCRYLKKLTWKGLSGRCFICLRPLPSYDPILPSPPPLTHCIRGGIANQREG
jgi:hypothetical protein